MKVLKSSRVAGVLVAAAVALPLSLSAAVPAHASSEGTIFGTSALNLRAGASSKTAKLITIPARVKLTLVCQQRGQMVHGPRSSDWWAKTTYKHKTGFVSRAYVKSSGSLPVCSAPTPGGTTGTVVGAKKLTLRRGEHSGYKSLGAIPKGTKLALSCKTVGKHVSGHYKSNLWLKTKYAGKTGYVSKGYVSTNVSKLPNCRRSAVNGKISRSEIIHRARFWTDRSVPYSQKAETGDAQGRSYRQDCSGMASMALHLNTSLATSASAKAWSVKRISKNSLQPGDLVGNLGRPAGQAGHVVIFLRWANSAKTKFYTLEETPGKAQQKLRVWGDSYWNRQAWRYTKLA